ELIPFSAQATDRLKRHLENHLARAPRIYGKIKIEFGRRLDSALDLVEAANDKAGRTRPISEPELWDALCRQSTVIQTFVAKLTSEETEFEAYSAEELGKHQPS